MVESDVCVQRFFRILHYRSPLAIISAAASLGLFFWLGTEVRLRPEIWESFGSYSGLYIPLLAIQGVGVAGMLIASERATFRVTALIHAIAFFVFAYYFRGTSHAVQIAALVFIVNAGLYGQLATSAPSLAVFSVLSGLLIGEDLILLLLFSAVVVAMSYFRERLVSEKQETEHLRTTLADATRATTEYQHYIKRADQVSRELERRRLTGDIHDVVGYALTNIKMMIGAARVMRVAHPEQLDEFLLSIEDAARDGQERMRYLLRGLRAVETNERLGDRAIIRLVRSFSEVADVDVRLEMGNLRWNYPDAVLDAVYHFVQEGLINAFRHGKATSVEVLMWRSQHHLSVTLTDDGTGAPSGLKEGIGLSGMRERAEALGGFIRVHRIPRGFSIATYLPDEALQYEQYNRIQSLDR